MQESRNVQNDEKAGSGGISRRAFLSGVGAVGLAASLPVSLDPSRALARKPGSGKRPLDSEDIARRNYGADHRWYEENIPFVDLPDRDIEDTYYYRWGAFKRHLRSTNTGQLITEFLPSVSWEGPNSTIAAALGHHLYEARWLHDRSYVEDYLHWWLGGGGDLRQYTSWIGDAVWADYLVSGDADVPTEHLDALRDNLDAWDSNLDRSKGLYWIPPVKDATEFTTSGLDVGDGWAGDAFRPTLNSYLYADARAIARISALKGDDGTARTYYERSDALKALVQENLWNEEFRHFTDRFSDKYPDRYYEFISGPELAGLVPWYFDLPDEQYDVAWEKVLDPDSLAGASGLRTITPSSPYYMVQHRTPGEIPGECEWNGPSWPYQTSQVLTGLANLLDRREQDIVNRDDYVELLRQYAIQQRKDGEPYIAENLDPDTGEWIADFPNRSEHYNHSTYADLVLSGLLGVRPSDDRTLRIRPLVPDDWDHFALQNLRYHGRDITVVYDESGKHYDLGISGLSVWVDGQLAARNQPLRGTDVDLESKTLERGPKTSNYAYNAEGIGLPVASASSTAEDAEPGDANDGRVWFDEFPGNRWVSDAGDSREAWYSVEMAGEVAVNAVVLHAYDDGDGIRAPVAYRVQYWTDGGWRTVRPERGSDRRPVGNTSTRVSFRQVRTSRVRALLRSRPGVTVGLSDFEVLGPRGQMPGVPTDTNLYEAEEGIVVRARSGSSPTASGGGYVGGMDFADSSVTLEGVTVDEAGVYTVGVRYANGLSGTATHSLTVNEGEEYTVDYPSTGAWGASGSWSVARVELDLEAGANSLKFTRGNGFAELDVVFIEGRTPAGG